MRANLIKWMTWTALFRSHSGHRQATAIMILFQSTAIKAKYFKLFRRSPTVISCAQCVRIVRAILPIVIIHHSRLIWWPIIFVCRIFFRNYPTTSFHDVLFFLCVVLLIFACFHRLIEWKHPGDGRSASDVRENQNFCVCLLKVTFQMQ